MADLLAIEKKQAVNDKGSMAEADEIDAQLKPIAKMLREAHAPLIYGLTQLTLEAQELAVELALCLRGAIDTPRGSRIPPRGTSLQLHGEARTTLGELRQYTDLLVFVDVEPTRELRESFAVEGSATLPQKQLLEFKLSAGEGATLETRVRELGCRNMDEVHALRKKLKVQAMSDSSHELLLATWQSAKYPVLVYDPEFLANRFGRSGGAYLIEQLERSALGRAKFGRAAAWPMGEASNQFGNAAGAEYVLTARTGYPCAVQFFSGYAEYLPGITDAFTLLTSEVCDLALFLGDYFSYWHTEAWYHTKHILITSEWSSRRSVLKPLVHLQCRSLEYETSGTIIREDGIPFQLPLSEAAKKTWLLSTVTLDDLEEGEEPEAAELASTEASKTAPRMEDLLRRLLELIREPTAAEQGAAR